MAITKSDRMLLSKDEIKMYLGGISNHTFRKYVEHGLPARYEDGGSWLAHADNIDEWFRIYTRVSAKGIISTIPDMIEIPELPYKLSKI